MMLERCREFGGLGKMSCVALQWFYGCSSYALMSLWRLVGGVLWGCARPTALHRRGRHRESRLFSILPLPVEYRYSTA